MPKHRDKTKVGRSAIVPYRPGEPAKARHDRRLRAALECENRVRSWANQRGFRLSVNNERHHWVFTRGERRAEWWPSSAKLVLDRDYENGIHAHDWQQVVQVLSDWIED